VAPSNVTTASNQVSNEAVLRAVCGSYECNDAYWNGYKMHTVYYKTMDVFYLDSTWLCATITAVYEPMSLYQYLGEYNCTLHAAGQLGVYDSDDGRVRIRFTGTSAIVSYKTGQGIISGEYSKYADG